MSELTFTTFGAVTEVDSGRVNIPDDRRADFQRAAAYFSAHTNRARLAVAMPNEGDAKLLAKQIKQWAEDTGRSASVKRDGTRVEFRFAKKRDASHAAGPVTVTHKPPAMPELIDNTAPAAPTPAVMAR